MPVLMACPNPNCNHPGPLGFTEGSPWGRRFYHSDLRPGDCPGMWEYNGKWYSTEAEGWKQYKKDAGPFDENWTKAFDARILHHNEEQFDKYIKLWSKLYA